MADHNDFGKKAEDLATEFLIKKNYKIITRNFRFLKAEIDIIAETDEFIVFVKDIQEHGNAINKAQEICQKIRNIEIDNFKGTISCSIGIAFYPEHGTTFKDLYNLADQALYQTKNQGRNGYTCYTSYTRMSSVLGQIFGTKNPLKPIEMQYKRNRRHPYN